MMLLHWPLRFVYIFIDSVYPFSTYCIGLACVGRHKNMDFNWWFGITFIIIWNCILGYMIMSWNYYSPKLWLCRLLLAWVNVSLFTILHLCKRVKKIKTAFGSAEVLPISNHETFIKKLVKSNAENGAVFIKKKLRLSLPESYANSRHGFLNWSWPTFIPLRC